MDITLDPKLEPYIQSEIDAGHYRDASEFIASCVRKQAEAEREHKLAELREMIQAGIDSVEEGNSYTMEEVQEYFREKRKQYRANEE